VKNIKKTVKAVSMSSIMWCRRIQALCDADGWFVSYCCQGVAENSLCIMQIYVHPSVYNTIWYYELYWSILVGSQGNLLHGTKKQKE